MVEDFNIVKFNIDKRESIARVGDTWESPEWTLLTVWKEWEGRQQRMVRHPEGKGTKRVGKQNGWIRRRASGLKSLG